MLKLKVLTIAILSFAALNFASAKFLTPETNNCELHYDIWEGGFVVGGQIGRTTIYCGNEAPVTSLIGGVQGGLIWGLIFGGAHKKGVIYLWGPNAGWSARRYLSLLVSLKAEAVVWNWGKGFAVDGLATTSGSFQLGISETTEIFGVLAAVGVEVNVGTDIINLDAIDSK